MMNPKDFVQFLNLESVNYFCGVPDSYLKSLIQEFEKKDHIPMPNEGSAIAHATGYYLAHHKPALVYMQNSGLGNAINPLLSSAHELVYGIGMLLFIGWRGEEGTHDEPQHLVQGESLLPMLASMKIKYQILSSDFEKAKVQIKNALEEIKITPAPYAFVLKKDLFKSSKSIPKVNVSKISRFEVIKTTIQKSPKAIYVATTGHTARELYQAQLDLKLDELKCFYHTGAMGHASQLALGLALHRPKEKVILFDGDGSMAMHLGNYLSIKQTHPANFKIICFNNDSHLSVGGQHTCWDDSSITKTVNAMGIKSAPVLKQKVYQKKLLEFLNSEDLFIEVLCKNEIKNELPRPKETHLELKQKLMDQLNAN